MLLQCCCNGGFSGGGKTSEPDCEAALFAEGVTLVAGERWVPGDVAGAIVSVEFEDVGLRMVGLAGYIYVAILSCRYMKNSLEALV